MMRPQYLVHFPEGVTVHGLELEQVGPTHFRVTEPPEPFTECINYLDIVEMRQESPDALRFVRVVEPSGWARHLFILPIGNHEQKHRSALSRVEQLGGIWIVDFGGMLQIFLPPGCPWDPSDEISAAG